MLLFYVDESGETNMRRRLGARTWQLAPGASPLFVLAAVGVHQASRSDVAQDITQIKDRVFPGWRTQPWGDTELKGSYLAQAQRRLDSGRIPLNPPGYRGMTGPNLANLRASLGSLFKKYRPVIYAIAVDKVAEVQRAVPRPAEGIAYAFLHQRLALLIDHVFGDDYGALVIADEQQTHERFFRSGRMLAMRTTMTSALPVQPNFELLLDRPMWINPDWHPLDREILQLPDLVAYAVSEAVRTGIAPLGQHLLWDDFASCFATHWGTGAVADAGLAIVPRPVAYPHGV